MTLAQHFHHLGVLTPPTMLRFNRFAALISSLTLTLGTASLAGSVRFLPDGKAVLENGLVSITVSNRVGIDHGILSWKLKEDGAELIDVLYGQTDYLKGHALGELFDPVEQGSRVGGHPIVGKLYVPERQGTTPSGAAVLTQSAEAEYRITRTLTLPDDATFIVADYAIENVSGKPVGFAMRLHTVWSPGNEGGNQSLQESILLPSEQKLLEIPQSLGMTAFREAFDSDRFFAKDTVMLPKPEWARNPSKNLLTSNWAVQAGTKIPRGFIYAVSTEAFAGYYNAIGATLEPLLKPVALARGEVSRARIVVGSFNAPIKSASSGGTGAYLTPRTLTAQNGKLSGTIIPLFNGSVEVATPSGSVRSTTSASANQSLSIDAAQEGAAYTLIAKNRKGAVIASFTHDGQLILPDELPPSPIPRTPVSNNVHIADTEPVHRFLSARDYRIFCDHNAPESHRDAAKRIARHLGVGIEGSEPKGKIIALGAVNRSTIIRDAGRLRNDVDKAWPGPGKGVISAHPNLELTTAPALLVAGSDEDGASAAIAAFERDFVAKLPPRHGFAFWTTHLSERVYANAPAMPEARGPIAVRAARGEYESAQAVITAFDDLSGIEVAATPLIHATSGKEIDNKQFTRARQNHGPLRIRWVESFPLKAENGWTGHPDALLDRPERELSAGRSQPLWLTFIISEQAEPGLYHSTLTCKANGIEQHIPIELTVRPFTIPRTGIPGDPYVSVKHLPTDDQRDLKDPHITAFVQNMVEHGMRYLHIGHKDMIRWHLDPSGGMKGANLPGFEVSEDGVLAMDASRFDDLIRKMDAAAKPFDVRFMVYSNAVVDDAWSIARFRKELPDRHANKPVRGGNDMLQNHYVEEMYGLYRKHVQRMGWDKRIHFKLSDEPPSFDFWWNNHTVAARNVGLPIMTAFNSIEADEAMKGVHAVAQWEVIYMKHDARLQKAVQAAGGQYGWYNCGPPPRIAAGAPHAEIKGYLWQAAKAELDFIGWWGIQNWESHHNTWFNRYSHWNSVTYPPHPFKPAWHDKKRGTMDAVILDSIRWEIIREGLEDTAYIALLREQIRKIRKDRPEIANAAETALNEIWSTLLPTLNHYAPNPTSIDEAREKVAALIIQTAP